MCSQDKKSVEPASCLVDTLGNEVRGICALKKFLILEGVVKLSVRHASRAVSERLSILCADTN